MRRFTLAAALAVALSVPALAADSVTGVVASVDAKERVITLDDGTKMIVDKDVDFSAARPGAKVTIMTRLDEDGHTAATAIEPAQ